MINFILGFGVAILMCIGFLCVVKTLSPERAAFKRREAICSHKGGKMLYDDDTTACYVQVAT